MGRHKKQPGEARDKFISVRVTEAEYAQLEAEATRAKRGLSAWARATLLAAVAPTRTGRKSALKPKPK